MGAAAAAVVGAAAGAVVGAAAAFVGAAGAVVGAAAGADAQAPTRRTSASVAPNDKILWMDITPTSP